MKAYHRGRLARNLLLALAAVGACGHAAAQYSWIGPNGVKQYSDQPPPASIPRNRILTQPGGSALPAAPVGNQAATPAVESGNADAGAPASPATAAPSLAQRNADFAKRRAEQAELDKKAADEQRLAADKAKNCDRARTYQRTLESGQRIAQVDSRGERAYMTDEQRARETAEANKAVGDCNKR